MSLEIERKFLVRPGSWAPGETRGVRYRQGYLSNDPARVVRIRTAGPSAFITIKGPTSGTVRSEYEYDLPLADAEAMLEHLCAKPLIEKTRYRQTIGGRVWEIDVFAGDNAGLVVAEVELPAADAPVVLPDWVGAEVSNDPRYFNSNLVQHPFSSWTADGDNARA
jgi:CYTH domain-containing protein